MTEIHRLLDEIKSDIEVQAMLTNMSIDDALCLLKKIDKIKDLTPLPNKKEERRKE